MTTDHATAAVQEPTGAGMIAQTPHSGWAAGSDDRPGGPPADAGVPAARVSAKASARASARDWGGAGGRWLIWVFRAVLWLVLLIIAFRGVVTIVTGQAVTGRTPGAATAPAASRAFPVPLARAYALAFGQVYLNYSAATAAHRAAELATFLPPGADPQLGWNGTGAQTLQFEQVAGVSVQDRHRAVVTLLARISGHLIELGVPVYATQAGMVVSGHPALLPPPSNVALPAPSAVRQDQAAKLALKGILPGFFRAYATGDAVRLAAFSSRGTVITGLGSVVSFGGLAKLIVPAAAGQVRNAVVTVSWRLASTQAHPAGGATKPAGGKASPAAGGGASPAAAKTSPSAGKTSPAGGASPAPRAAAPASVQMTYAVTVVRHGTTWLVRSIGPAAAQPWPSP
ncbi:MAG: conjugal transfer protein [Streptosporangiaceae bacterium]